MRVKCVLCDTIQSIEDQSTMAKKLRNRPIHTFMCQPCQERITDKTNQRKATGLFMLYRSPQQENDW
ncbi:hypothetical protein A374_12840 [Fictibacillus macauensis ZFHKF-1]|uniref:DUF2197 domain-containing protein n=1 Tax=Fictibacillus macauensis ZFHKF-1 TaxID=1196324 RepID=I8UDQ0_9BACL|nr:YlaI family protein [Fictibacillus macauensis]EIT84933.1 hypothetical protein A374_12840 [Fictibacillus macauensis ZFHKF-1]